MPPTEIRRIIAQHVDAPGDAGRDFDHVFRIPPMCDVGVHEARVPRYLLNIGDNHRSPRLGEQVRNRAADPMRASGHNGDFPLQRDHNSLASGFPAHPAIARVIERRPRFAT